jgi:TonB family protein
LLNSLEDGTFFRRLVSCQHEPFVELRLRHLSAVSGLVAILLVHTGLLAAQTVGGRLMELESSRVIIGGRVALVDSSLVIVDSTLSDSSGAFYLNAPRPGIYALLVRLEGSEPQLSSVFHLVDGEFHQHTLSIRTVDSTLLHVTDTPPRQLPNNPSPRYPPEFLQSPIPGKVVVEMVIDTLGDPEIGTVRVKSSTDPAFTRVVKEVLPRLKFSPASYHGRPLRQMIQIPFEFAIEMGVPHVMVVPSAGKPPQGRE